MKALMRAVRRYRARHKTETATLYKVGSLRNGDPVLVDRYSYDAAQKHPTLMWSLMTGAEQKWGNRR